MFPIFEEQQKGSETGAYLEMREFLFVMLKTTFLTILVALCLVGCTPDQPEPVVAVSDNPPMILPDDDDSSDDDSIPTGDNDSDVGNDDSGGGDDDDSEASDSGDDDATDPSPITWTECSGMPGDKACDFTYQDQDGTDWTLYENYGTVMVLDFSTMWCGVCRNIAGDVQGHMDAFTDLGYDFLWVTVLIDDDVWGNPPDARDIQAWVDAYGMTTSRVLVGDRSIIDLTAANGYPISSWPTLVVIDETLTVYNGLLGWNEQIVLGWVEDVLGITSP